MSVNDERIDIQHAIEIEKEKIRKKYLDSAEEIVSGYYRERELSMDYEGRQIFELLQNADDEANDSSGKVHITFDGKTLTVSNTGNPFTLRGVKSLLYPSASPKKNSSDKIGCKGLGFRSILTWANSVTVASKGFAIQFSRKNAIDFLRSILDENPNLKEEIEASSHDEYPIATLTCPKIITQDVLEESYATSIIIECREELAQTIEEQIVRLQFEELIFLPHLNEIEISCNQYQKNFFKVVEGNEVIIETRDLLDHSTESSSWRLYKKVGTIQSQDGKDKSYEFIIAYDATGKKHGEVLYSYFKTDVKLQFPALIHGTFELTSDRNNLQKQSRINQQLTQILAKFMVETAIAISEEQKECSYAPLSLVIASDMDIILKDIYRLDAYLRDEVREKKILPTIENKYISINQLPKYTSSLCADILDPDLFPELLKSTDNKVIQDYLQLELGLRFYKYEEFCNRLNNHVQEYSFDDRAELIALTLQNYPNNPKADIFPHLLIDNLGENILDSSRVYLVPTEEQLIALPEWADIRFLSPELEKKVLTKLHYSGRRELVNKLSRFNMDEYSFDKLLYSVVNQITRASNASDRCTDVLNWLWEYYNKNREKSQLPSKIHVKVICRDGVIRDAKDCYIGSEYGNTLGERLISLYSSNFVVLDESKMGHHDAYEIECFLLWLGVAKYPRIIKKSLSKDESNAFLNGCYPLYVSEDKTAYQQYELNNFIEISIGTVEHFEQILEEADFNDLLAWFILDTEINERIKSETEEKNLFSCIKGIPSRKQNIRTVKAPYIKSYLRYCLSVSKWIPDEHGNKEAPDHCCFEENELAPFIIVPKIQQERIRNEVGRNCIKEVDTILSWIGVADTFQEMKETVVYQALMKLPELDPECKLGRPLYRKIIRSSEFSYGGEKNPYYRDFVTKGAVLAKQGGKKQYVPVSQVSYADKKVFSEEILSAFYMFDIDARSGEEKIQKLFGVKPLKYTKVEIDGDIVLHPLNESFKKEYLRFLPFVFACRSELKNANSDFRRLKDSRVVLCSSIRIRYDFGTETKVSTLKAFENVYLRLENTAYICLPDSIIDFYDMKSSFEFADSVAELITTILDVNEDKGFFRDLFRDNNLDRERKMRIDKGDENLNRLTAAKQRFSLDTDPRYEFWMTLADITHISLKPSNVSTASEIISAMGLSPSIDAEVDYDNLNSFDNIPFLSTIFSQLGIDVLQYNTSANQTLQVSQYWSHMLKVKMTQYRSSYQAFLLEKLTGEEDSANQYDQYMEEYNYFEPELENSLFVDIEEVFYKKFSITFSDLDKYSDKTVQEVLKKEKEKVSEEDIKKLNASFAPNTIDAYLIMGRINELLCSPTTETIEPNSSEPSENQDIKKLVAEALAAPVQGFSSISTQVPDDNTRIIESTKQRHHQRTIHSEVADRKKQEIGIIGEAYVYKALLALYPDVRWVSGNAEKAGRTSKGDDTCGYDIKYTDTDGRIQYVEVKTSRNEEILFFLSDSELHFARNNASNYEIIFVVIDENQKSANKLWRLGHIFDFSEDEDLFHNQRFFVESDGYKITAKPVNE